MSLADEYRRQFGWRSWGAALDLLPPLRGSMVLDLGCAIGDVSEMLTSRGARVIGLDTDPDLVSRAKARAIPNVEVRQADIRSLDRLDLSADGIWASFVAAYFPGLTQVLQDWSRRVCPGGWIALTEVDDLFAHDPLPRHAEQLLEAYADEAYLKGRYDFRMGGKLRSHVESAGLVVLKEVPLADQEFSYSEAALPDVLKAWEDRFARMKGLQAFAGGQFDALRREFISCLASHRHRSRSRVVFCLAEKPGERADE